MEAPLLDSFLISPTSKAFSIYSPDSKFCIMKDPGAVLEKKVFLEGWKGM